MRGLKMRGLNNGAGALALTIGLALTACGEAAEPAPIAGDEASVTEAAATEPADTSATSTAQADADDASDERDIRAFIDRIYGAYSAAGTPDFLGDPMPAFEPQLATRLATLTAEAEATGEIPDALGADPICGCQDWDGFGHTIEAIDLQGERAVVGLKVRNFGEVTARTVELVKTPSGWRIYDLDGEFRASVLGG